MGFDGIDFSASIYDLIELIAKFIILAWLLTGVNNKIKSLLPEKFNANWMWVISSFLWVTLLVWVTIIFPDMFPLSIGQACFFGVFVGLSASGLYDLGLGKNQEKKEAWDDIPKIHNDNSLPDIW